MTSTTVSAFRANIKYYLDSVINNAGTVVINRGQNAAVLISLEEYNSIKDTERVMSSHALSAELDAGVEELKYGKAITVDLDEI